jgi:hypothetical protein
MPQPGMVEAHEDVTWLAIRQPAVVRLLERELAVHDRDALAAALALACQLLGGAAARGERRLDQSALSTGLVAVRSGRCDRGIIRGLRDRIDALPVVLTRDEEDAVATVIAAVMCAVARVEDVLVG